LRSNASRREVFPALHVGLQHANQHPKPSPFSRKAGLFNFIKSTRPYSRKRALHFRRKAKSFTLRSNASRREVFPVLHVGLQHANQHPKPPSFFKKSGVVLLPLVAKRIIFYKSTQPYSRKRALHFRHRRKASHCEAMLHAGKYSRRFTLVCNTQTNTPSPPTFFKKSGVVLLPLVAKRIIFYKSTQPYSRKRALHFRRKAKSFTLRSNASRREVFPALHVGLQHANQHPKPHPFSKKAG